MILIGSNLFLLHCIFYIKKFKLKQLVYHKKVFPSAENSFLQEKIRNTFIVHTSTLREKSIVHETTAAIRQDTALLEK